MNKLLFEDITFKLRGALFEVYNTLGSGFKEQIYQKALAKELANLNLNFKEKPSIKVDYKGNILGNYFPDFIVEDKIIIEIKAAEITPRVYQEQLLHYLKSTNFTLGFLVNFGSKPLLIKRIIWTKSA